MCIVLSAVFAIGIGFYFTVLPPEAYVRPHILAQDVTIPLKLGDKSSQSDHIWNFGAPLAGDVSDRVSKRDYKETSKIPRDISEFPRSVLLHEANLSPTNMTFIKLLYQVFLFFSGVAVLRKYVVPMLV